MQPDLFPVTLIPAEITTALKECGQYKMSELEAMMAAVAAGHAKFWMTEDTLGKKYVQFSDDKPKEK